MNGKVAVVYCSVEDFPIALEQERIADDDNAQIAEAVKETLEKQGQPADILAIHPEHLEMLMEYDWIFNLAENIVCYDELEFNIVNGMERLGLHFTGSSAATLKTCLNKAITKEKIKQKGVLTPAYTVINPGEPMVTDLVFSLFVKPLKLDGSVGVTPSSHVNTLAELEARVSEIYHLYGQASLVEEYIEGRDISAAVLGEGGSWQVLPLSEIVYRPDFIGPKVLTYEACWVEDSRAYLNNDWVCPCPLSGVARERIVEATLTSINTLGCRDYARVDFRLQGDTPYVLEVNPNPCLHPAGSGFMRSVEAAGLDFPATIQRILDHSRKMFSNPASRSQNKYKLT
jgi:D-alanine-D-alanine ligase